jgi:hypothetical protein
MAWQSEEDKMNYTITEADKKRLIVFLKKCPCVYKGDIGLCEYDCPELRREDIFQAPNDRQDLCEALMREGKWEEFEEFSPTMWSGNVSEDGPFYYWLLVEQPERCNYIIAKFLEEE